MDVDEPLLLVEHRLAARDAPQRDGGDGGEEPRSAAHRGALASPVW